MISVCTFDAHTYTWLGAIPQSPICRQTRCNIDSSPAPVGDGKTRRNCFERTSLDIGHNRLPDPPLNITSLIVNTLPPKSERTSPGREILAQPGAVHKVPMMTIKDIDLYVHPLAWFTWPCWSVQTAASRDEQRACRAPLMRWHQSP